MMAESNRLVVVKKIPLDTHISDATVCRTSAEVALLDLPLRGYIGKRYIWSMARISTSYLTDTFKFTF